MDEVRMTPLVRTYSLQLTDSSILSQSLGAVAKAEQESDKKQAVELQEWQEWIRFEWTSSDPSYQKLTHHSKLLADCWKRFGSQFDLESVKCIAGHTIPTIDTLLRVVNDAKAEMESNKQAPMGRAKERFLQFTNLLSDYSFLFSVIPNNDKYTSLITGVLSSIAKAAAKYQETAEKISQALDRIAYNIGTVKKRSKIAGTPEVRGFVIEFFVKLFELLCCIMSWYQSRPRRILGSFVKSFDKELNGKVDAVEQTLKDLSEETNLITQLRVNDLRGEVAAISSTTVNTNRDVQDVKALLQQLVVKISTLEDVGYVATQQFNSIHQDFMRQRVVTTDRRMIGYSSPLVDNTQSQLSSLSFDGHVEDCTITHFSKSDLLQYSQQLKPFVDDGRDSVSKDDRPTARAVLPREVIGEMQKWMASENSKMLWVEGISSHSSEPVLSMAALHMCSIASNSGIPCVSYFCTSSNERRKATQKDQRLTHTEATCVSLLYSIIIQLCEYLPNDFVGTEGFDHRFQLLDGTLSSSEVAVDLIKDLLNHLPPLTVWVLDRFPFAKTKSTAPYIAKLIRVLRHDDTRRVTKVLYTTEGNTHWLADNLQADEHFLASRMALNKPGRLMPGGVSPLFRGQFQRDRQQI